MSLGMQTEADRGRQFSAVYKAYSAFVDSMETEIVDIPEEKGLWR